IEQTIAAMRAGAELIYQAPLGNSRWYGRADFLTKSSLPSELGGWSYEVTDAKLATETRAGTVLQLCVYSELLAEIQGIWPAHAYVVAPHHNFKPEAYRLADYWAYYRLVKRRLETALGDQDPATYPEPVQHCEVCAWWGPCNTHRRTDDHLCFVAGISRMQIKELRRFDVNSLERLAQLRDVPKPARGSRDALTRVRDQAAIQLKGRQLRQPQYEILEPVGAEHGLAMLPAPATHDIFLDLEGDRLAAEGGREYLFGYVTSTNDDYVGVWATNPAEEKRAFEQIVDLILATFRAHPDIHVYHFGAYEPTQFKRLSGRYATRETELDTILRAELFVDLHTIVRHSLKASVESYSIKELEQFYGLNREQDLRAATTSRRAIEWAIEMHEDVAALAAHVAAVERYNREDCVSAKKLYEWLELLRAAAEREHRIQLPRPELKSGDASQMIEGTAGETQRVMARLLQGVPVDPDERNAEEHALWLMAHLLEWHRREDKAAWWEYYRLKDLPLEDYEEERSALTGLTYLHTSGGTAKRPTHRYSFPPQDHDIRKGDEVCIPPDGVHIGDVEGIDVSQRTIDIQHGGKFADERPERIFVRRNVPSGSKPAVLLELGRWIAAHGIDAPGEHRAARDLILRHPPRLLAGSKGLIAPHQASPRQRAAGIDKEITAARRLAFELDHGVLPIQGPPGTGKTFTGSHMILELLKAGKKVGVTAVSHEVIRNLLSGVCERAAEQGVIDFKCLHKGKPKAGYPEAIHAIDDYKRVTTLFKSAAYSLLGGTAWLWARPEFQQSVDVLFIDEAGQMSLADVLAVAAGARSLVLLGDPQQLEQPQQASHPPGTQASALEHILGGAKTISDDRGMFLHQTRRLHPKICEFTAEVFYENKLSSFPGLERQALVSKVGSTAERFGSAGLVHVPVEHQDNQSRSEEEVKAIVAIVAELTAGAVVWRAKDGEEAPLTRADLMIVAPYNAQVTALAARLPDVRIGTVDKFQGQQAPVVIVSLTTSSADDAPRGMTFLYSANRLNVATSRAKGLCILVGSPKIFEPDCRTPEQMRLANAFCRYLELAKVVTA
ncbi:MAG TPA: TM0106 family RecB-like putative nuclease, partial [Gammaproteobacteria bacterium]|nr:TM0106 family RecB-like putative nuclease [Gammaproteobacteria bacterium]